MNFLSMKYFLTLAEEKSFTRAAEKLHITQQTLSAHMAGLEKEVGMKLFIRHVPLELTDGGEVFRRYAQIFQRNELALRRELSDVSGSESGILRIGVAPARGQVLLPKRISLFHKHYPHVKVVLSEMANEAIWNALKRDEIDLAIARVTGEMPGMVYEPFVEEEIVLLLADSLWQTLAMQPDMQPEVLEGLLSELPSCMAQCPFLVNSEDDIAGALARHLFRRAAFEPQVVVESENMNTMLALCVQGLGAYFCPRNLAEAMVPKEKRKDLHMISLREGTYDISFGYQEKAHRWSMIENFIKAIRR